MSEIIKPNSLSTIWSQAGEKIKPTDEKINTGWVVEIPRFQYENWITNRQDTAIAHFNQRGIPEWDQYTYYVAGKSYVQGRNGKIYLALVDGRGRDPTVKDNGWKEAFLSPDDAATLRLFNGYVIFSGNAAASVNRRYYAVSTSNLTLPATASNGDAVTVNKAGGSEVWVKTANNAGIFTHKGLFTEIIYDYSDEISFVWTGVYWAVM